MAYQYIRKKLILASLAATGFLWPVLGFAACPQGQYACHGECIDLQNLCLLEPIPGGVTNIGPGETADLGALFTYINGGLWQWAISIAVAVTVMQVVIAGATLAVGGQEKAGEAKTKITWAIIGLLMLLLAGAILSTINPIGFSQ